MTQSSKAMLRKFSSAEVSTASASDFFELLKPRVMSLVIFSALVGMLLAPSYTHPVMMVVSLISIAVGAGASGALNMWYDADIDAQVKRTVNRPIPSGRIASSDARDFGIILSVFSVTLLWIASNVLAAGLLAFTILFYAVIYTMGLKRNTPQNIVIGGAAGAFPPMIGWVAMTGEISLFSVTLFLIIFLWTPPHFWALAMVKADDYQRIGVPMLPNVAGRTVTKKQIIAYTIAMIAATMLPYVIGESGYIYLATALVLNGYFLFLAIQLYRHSIEEQENKIAMKLFGFSIVYLFSLFTVLLIDGVIYV